MPEKRGSLPKLGASGFGIFHDRQSVFQTQAVREPPQGKGRTPKVAELPGTVKGCGIVVEMGKKLGVEKVHPHKFRRTMATRAIEKGMSIEQVQKILGHEQIDTTLRYAMVNQNNVKLSHRKYIS